MSGLLGRFTPGSGGKARRRKEERKALAAAEAQLRDKTEESAIMKACFVDTKEELSGRLAGTASCVEALQDEIDTRAAQATRDRERIAALEAMLDGRAESGEGATLAIARERDQFAAEKAALASRARGAEEEVARLTSECDTLRQHNGDLQSASDDVVRAAERRAADAERRAADLAAALDAVRADAGAKDQSVAIFKNNVGGLEDSLRAMSADNARLTEALEAKDAQIAALGAQIAAISADRHPTDGEVSTPAPPPPSLPPPLDPFPSPPLPARIHACD